MTAYTTKPPTAVETARVSERQQRAALHLIAAIAGRHNVTTEEVLGYRRSQRVVEARHEAMRLVRSAGLTLGQIGLIFNRDHSTVSKSISRANARIQKGTDDE